MTTDTIFTDMLEGKLTHDDIASYLTTLADRGETADDIVSAARALRQYVSGFTAPAGAIDCCGTGGDGRHTLNISTATAFVLAACGVPVAKHGNRASSSKCGAADVLEHLGINLDAPIATLENALAQTKFCFLMAPLHHRAMAHVAPVRKALGRRTIFNLVGPLSNPAHVKHQMVGVYAPAWLMPMAQALKALGSKTGWVVHGDGMDEITLSGQTHVAMLHTDGKITEQVLSAADFGLNTINPADIIGDDAAYNARALIGLLEGQKSAYRDTVLANAAGVLVMMGITDNLKNGVFMAAQNIDNGAAYAVFTAYKDMVA
jgi:anthranilate phosphoribosyltransferase